jgi:hypothetical protein
MATAVAVANVVAAADNRLDADADNALPDPAPFVTLDGTRRSRNAAPTTTTALRIPRSNRDADTRELKNLRKMLLGAGPRTPPGSADPSPPPAWPRLQHAAAAQE